MFMFIYVYKQQTGSKHQRNHFPVLQRHDNYLLCFVSDVIVDQGHHQSLHQHHLDDHGGHDESFLRIAEVVAENFRPFDPLFSPSPIQRLKVVFHHHSYNPPLSLQ